MNTKIITVLLFGIATFGILSSFVLPTEKTYSRSVNVALNQYDYVDLLFGGDVYNARMTKFSIYVTNNAIDNNGPKIVLEMCPASSNGNDIINNLRLISTSGSETTGHYIQKQGVASSNGVIVSATQDDLICGTSDCGGLMINEQGRVIVYGYDLTTSQFTNKTLKLTIDVYYTLSVTTKLLTGDLSVFLMCVGCLIAGVVLLKSGLKPKSFENTQTYKP